MAAGNGLTVTGVVMMHPVANVYVMVEVPVVAPVIIPDDEPIVAFVLLLAQVPPPPSLKVVVKPRQTWFAPEIAAGNAFTVNGAVLMQPVAVRA